MKQIKWSEIEAECGDFRDGFVQTFRKYEGQPTDEKDGQGRTVKVTATSFARHMGIAEPTFRRWVGQDRRGDDPAPRDRTRESIRRMLPKEKAALAREVIEDLEDDDLLDVATEAARKVSEKVQAEGRERKRDARANREERSTDPSGTHLRLIRLDLAKADDAIARAINAARDAGWSESQTDQLLARIAKTEGLIAVLKLAVTNETDIDWDAALAKLVEEEQAA